MLKKLKGLDHHQALRVTHIIFYSGLALLLLSVAVGGMSNSTTVMGVMAVLGVIATAAGVAFGYVYVKCPACGESLMLGGRIPGSLPNFCPHCGKPL